jgi:hypothetical protein
MWDGIFPSHPPLRGETVDDYFEEDDDNYGIV